MPTTETRTLQRELAELVLVAAGAVPGAVLRWQLAVHVGDDDLIANVVGSLLLGLLAGLPSRPRRQLLLGIGFCGSLTTFSSWMVNTIQFLASGQWPEALGLLGLRPLTRRQEPDGVNHPAAECGQ